MSTSTPSPAGSGAGSPAGLAALEARLKQDLQWLCLPAKPWVPQQADPEVLDVAIIGGGMAGLALSASLRHLGIRNRIYDQAPAGFEGPWATTARMETLRSPKELTGPALGLPALTFRAWFEAQFGLEAWNGLDKIPRLQWADYLRWYRQVLDLEVLNQHRVTDVLPQADGTVQIELEDQRQNPARALTVRARHLVLATGRDGLGGAWVPAWAHQVPRDRWVHSSDVWDGERMRGLRVAVVGGGSSAMDVAATALESGAQRVDLLIRRADLPRINKGKGAGHPGMVHGYPTLPDEWKWRFRHYINVQQVPPPHGSTLRVSRHANAHFHLGTPILGVSQRSDGSLRVDTAKGPLAADVLIFSTGFRTDWSLRPEYARLAPHVRTWQDRFTAPAGQEDSELDQSPDLGPLFEFQQRTPGSLPGLERVHCFCYAAALSQGAGAGDIPQISEGAQRLARGLAAQLLSEDAAQHFATMEAYADPELDGQEWTPAPALPPYEEVDSAAAPSAPSTSAIPA